MNAVFLKVLNMSIAASWLILAVILLRLVLKGTPKWITVALWGIVALRLAIPFSFESTLSLIPSAETFSLNNIQYETPAVSSGIPSFNNAVNPALGETFARDPGGSVNPLYVLTSVLSVVWLIGIAAMMLYAIISYVRVRRGVAESIPYKENIFLCDHVKSPFILGLVNPKIYLPSGMDGAAMEPVIAHETAHLARRDHWWKPLGFLILAVHWFNPLCWAAYVMLCRDIELACDEKVIRGMDLDEKKQYSTALLTCSVGRRLVTICPLAFGEVGVKERVKNVMNYKKPAFWVILLAVAACIVVVVCFATNPKQNAFNLRVHISAESEENVFYTDEEVSSRSGVMEITAGQDVGDTMVRLLLTEGSGENAEPQYITPGMPVRFQVEKGAWYKIGIGPFSAKSAEDVYISVKNVEVRISEHVHTAYISDDVTEVKITHFLMGQLAEWTIEGDDIAPLQTWANGLECESVTFEEGQTPGDAEGQEAYWFELTGGDCPGFDYMICGPDDCYLMIESNWYIVNNPSNPPVKDESQTENSM